MGHRGDDVSHPAGSNGRPGTDPASVTGGSAQVCRRYGWDWIQGNRIQIGVVSLVGRFGVLGGQNPSLPREQCQLRGACIAKLTKVFPVHRGRPNQCFVFNGAGPELRTGCGPAVNQTPSPVAPWRSMDGAGVWCRRGCWVYAHPMPSARGLFAGVSTVRTHPGTQAGCVVRLHANRLIPPRGGTQGFLSMPMLSRNLSWIAFRVLLG